MSETQTHTHTHECCRGECEISNQTNTTPIMASLSVTLNLLRPCSIARKPSPSLRFFDVRNSASSYCSTSRRLALFHLGSGNILFSFPLKPCFTFCLFLLGLMGLDIVIHFWFIATELYPKCAMYACNVECVISWDVKFGALWFFIA